MIGLAFWATVINYLDRQTLSVAAPVLREQFHMSNVDYSRVVFAFMLAYTIMNGLSGTLIDRLGTRVGYALCIGWWSVSSILHAFAQGTWSLGAFSFLLGIGEAGQSRLRVVSHARARHGLRDLQQRVIGRRYPRSAHRRLGSADLGMAPCLHRHRHHRIDLAAVLVADLPHAGYAAPRRRR
jgi:MFS family permease